MAALTDGRALDRTTDLTQGALQDIDNVVAIIEASSMSASAIKRALDSLRGATDTIHEIETDLGKGSKSLVRPRVGTRRRVDGARSKLLVKSQYVNRFRLRSRRLLVFVVDL